MGDKVKLTVTLSAPYVDDQIKLTSAVSASFLDLCAELNVSTTVSIEKVD